MSYFFNWLPNEIHIEILKFVLFPTDKWKSNWKTISVISKQWNKNSWITFYTLISIEERTDLFINSCERGYHYYVQQTLLHDKRVYPAMHHSYATIYDRFQVTNDNAAITMASANGHIEIVKLLLQYKQANSSIENYAIVEALIMGHKEVIRLLLQDTRLDPSASGSDILFFAAGNGRIEAVKMLMQDKRVDPSANRSFAFVRACQAGKIEAVKLILQDKRVDPSARCNWAIQSASQNGYIEVVKLLLQDKRVDPSADDNAAIKSANQNGHIELVKLLLQDKRVDASDMNNEAIRSTSTFRSIEEENIPTLSPDKPCILTNPRPMLLQQRP